MLKSKFDIVTYMLVNENEAGTVEVDSSEMTKNTTKVKCSDLGTEVCCLWKNQLRSVL
jgi:hypothetical protein